jgi:LuxR family glucitol operon transcriptional activator
MGVDRQRLGTLLDGMIRMLAARQHRPMGEVMQQLGGQLGVKPDAIYKWRQGTFLPSDGALQRLVQVGVTEAGMDRAWADEVFALTNHPDRAAILARLIPPLNQQLAPRVRYNLPNRPVIELRGRDDEVARIFERLSPDSRHWLIALIGPGGIGKSALALAVAWAFAEGAAPDLAGRFDAVIWASAQPKVLDAWGAADRPGTVLRGVDDLYATLVDVVGDGGAGESPAAGLPHERAERGRAAARGLRRAGRVLLIVDELDALDDDEQRRVLSFLRELPAPTKAIVTARFHEDLPYPMTLDPLAPAALVVLVDKEAEARQVPLSSAECGRIAAAAYGNPLAAQWILAQVVVHARDLADVTRPEAEYHDPLYHYLFEPGLRSHVPSELIRALLDGGPSGALLAALSRATSIAEWQCRRAMHRLERLGVASQVAPDRYAILPQVSAYLRRAYAAGATANQRATAKRASTRPAAPSSSTSMTSSRRMARSTRISRPDSPDLVEHD